MSQDNQYVCHRYVLCLKVRSEDRGQGTHPENRFRNYLGHSRLLISWLCIFEGNTRKNFYTNRKRECLFAPSVTVTLTYRDGGGLLIDLFLRPPVNPCSLYYSFHISVSSSYNGGKTGGETRIPGQQKENWGRNVTYPLSCWNSVGVDPILHYRL